jgi:uroporphyrin-III C-methyltransferase/precorrin-2 dehydrogenase/sirohydrochlorin ferrochelatase
MKRRASYLPVFLDLRGMRALVVGAGAVAARKIAALLAGGASVTVAAREHSPAVEERAGRGEIAAVRGEFRPDLLDGAELVFAASSDRALNARVAREARRRRIPVNAADAPDDCTFILPAVVRGEEFTAAVSTGGRNPGAARALREFLEEHRAEVSVRLERGRARPRIAARKGTVHIVGAGPGDPDLLTVRALGLLRSADAVVHDYLVPEEILPGASESREDLLRPARPDRRARGGAEAGGHPRDDGPAGAGRKSVVRLKSGDPLTFGRGGEEAEYLAREGVPFEIVPGITAAAGCAAAAGVPLTHRGLSSSVTFVAGHEAGDKGESGVDWNRLPKGGTLAIYMESRGSRRSRASCWTPASRATRRSRSSRTGPARGSASCAAP